MELTAAQRLNSVGNSLYLQGNVEYLRNKYKTLVEKPFLDIIKNTQYNKENEPSFWKKLLDTIYFMVRRFVKGFILTYGFSTTLALISSLIKAKFNIAKLILNWKSIFFSSNINIAAFIGCFLSIFETFMRFVRLLNFGTKETRSFFGGLLAGSALFLIPSVELRISVAVFFLMRALEAIFKHAVLNKIIPLFPHSELILMSLASSQVLWSFLYSRNSLEPGYRRFLDLHGGSVASAYSIFEDGLSSNSPHLVAFNNILSKRGNSTIINPTPCDLWHPGQECSSSAISNFVSGFKRAFPLYMPVYILPMLMFRFPRLVQSFASGNISSATSTLLSTFYAIVRSSVFLTTYCSVARIVSCIIFNTGGWGYKIDGIIAGLVAGNTLIIEQASRRQEVALYVAGQAVRSFYFAFVKFLPNMKYGEVIVFALSMSILMNVYITKSHLMRPGYFSLFRFLFGSGGFHEGFPSEQMKQEISGNTQSFETIKSPEVSIYKYTDVPEYNEKST